MPRTLGCLPLVLAVLASSACTGSYEPSVRRDLARQRDRYSPPIEVSKAGSQSLAKNVSEKSLASETGGPQSLSSYVALAVQNNPELKAAFERWRASVYRISRASRLPEPTLSFGYFLQSVETRVGPQRARLSLQQAFPWPTKLTAGADAASTQARAMQRRFEAQILAVAQRVAHAYWNLWQLRKARALHREHLELLRGLSEAARARVSTGAATLADLQQFDLASARLEDNILGMNEAERTAEAQLRAAIGQRGEAPVATAADPGEAALPAENEAALAKAATEHPLIESSGLLAEAAEYSAQSEAAERFPMFTLGADWILTDEAVMPDVADSGKDAIIVGAGLRLPLWQGSYGDSIAAARADARAQLAEQHALTDRAHAELKTSLSNVRDAVRRIRLHSRTLVPLAESAYESVLGAYMVGRGSVAQTLLAQRDLLELRVELDRARSDYAKAWARLEEITGREVRRAAADSRGTDVQP